MQTALRLLSIKQAMQYLGVKSYNTFKTNYLNEGLPLIVINNSKKVDKSDIDRFLNDHKVSEVKS
ncbi:MAG: helix-turn-helix domain-containing protein [Lentilactobacillus hilgardii]|uniref:helix-turn-helix domain-containing protein n=1 Tax=Lentilactobacillus hilgardii TaxID=1588 RepID=UPI001CC1CC88|nr:helix-turn-helix domain-containing protein [Lentilactobacillus hilgardii]MBZ2200053.1 DNA-binding protein [Lentilactobacillus hilgardii]MBZ2203173.1 DNA-binding protein [Lentilactobacillus hilgardii]